MSSSDIFSHPFLRIDISGDSRETLKACTTRCGWPHDLPLQRALIAEAKEAIKVLEKFLADDEATLETWHAR